MGRAKGLIRLEGRPILAHLLERAAWPGPTLLVTARGREHPPGWEEFDREVTDAVAGEGPLRGVLTALENVTTDVMVVAVVDMPAVTAEQLGWLTRAITAAADAGVLAVMMRRSGGGGGGGGIEPFPSGYRRAAVELVRSRIGAGERAVRALGADARVRVVDTPAWPEIVWTNLNRPADVEAYLRRSVEAAKATDQRSDA